MLEILGTTALIIAAKYAAELAAGVVVNMTDRQLCDIGGELKNRIPALRGLPAKNDAALAFCMAQFQALERLIDAFAKEDRPEWRANPVERPQVFIDKARAFARVPIVGNVTLDEDLAGKLTNALDAALLNPQEGSAGERLGRLRSQAEDAVLDQLRAATAPVRVPEAFVARFRASGDDGKEGWFSLFSKYVSRQIKTNQRFRDILFAGEFATIKEMIADLGPRPPLDLKREEFGDASRFYFAAQRADFVGRGAELVRLDAFLTSDRRFSWWLVCGSGGTGKSRLALQLCLRHGDKWATGFLRDEPFEWSQWRPTVPTLIVVDYAGGRSKDVGKIVHTLRGRAEMNDLAHPVRLLLLERKEDGPWFDRFIGSGGDRHLTEGVQHDEPLGLADLDDAALAAIARAYGAQISGSDGEQAFAAKLRDIDPEARPLFAALLGDAVADGRKPNELDRQTLIRDVLQREDDKFWKPAGVTEADRNLLALATMTYGVLVNTLPIKDAGNVILPSDEDYDPARFEAMTGRDSTDVVPPLEPDLIGELFVLDRLDPRKHRRPVDRNRAAALCSLAWRVRPPAMAWLVVAAAFDYPDHPAVPPLRALASETEEQRRLWSTAMADAVAGLCDAGEFAAASGLYAAVKSFAETHSGEPALRENQAQCAVSLLTFLISAGKLAAARKIYADVQALAEAHPMESSLHHARDRCAGKLGIAYNKSSDFESATEIITNAFHRPTVNESEDLLESRRYYDKAHRYYDLTRQLTKTLPREIEWRRQLAVAAFNLLILAPLTRGRKWRADANDNLYIQDLRVVDETLIREVVDDPALRDALLWLFDQPMSRSDLPDELRKHLTALREAVNRLFR